MTYFICRKIFRRTDLTILRTLKLAALGAAAMLSTQMVWAEGLELSSPDIKVNEPIPAAQVFNGFGCTGQNISPALNWKNAPAGTKSFAVMVHDPDAPTGGAGFWHWVVLNLPASTAGLPRGAGTADGKGLPAGAKQITTDYGNPGWGGPCPPKATSLTCTTSPCTP